MEEPLRIRIVFEDRKILSKSQRSAGLNQAWLLLSPNVTTISDLASHVCTIFKLKRSCPDSLILSMDDFVLPPFESTCVLKDKDVISVRRKDGTQMAAIDFDANPHSIQYSGVQENGRTIYSDKHLAIREFGDDSGQHKRKKSKDLCAHNESADHTGTSSKSKKKRKHSDEIRGSKRKKLKASSKKSNVSGDEDEDVAEEVLRLRSSLDSSEKKSCSLKSSNKNDKPSTSNERHGTLVNSWRVKNFDLVTSSARRDKSEEITDLNSPAETCTSLKHSLQNRQKNSQLVSLENAIISTHGTGDIPAEQNEGTFQKTANSAKLLHKKDKQSDKDGKSDAVFASQPDDCKQPKSVLMKERSVQAEENIGENACKLHVNDGGTKVGCMLLQAEENIGENACKPHVNDGGTKVQSRSNRRKKAKRQWAREMKSQEAQNTQNQTPPDVNHRETAEQQKTGQDTEMENDIVPVVVRPGHIRFQPLDEEQSQWQSQTQETMEILQWKGTTSKKKGQKWGKEKVESKWHEANGYEVQYNREENGSNCNTANGYKEQYNRKENGYKWNDAKGYKEQYNRNEKTMSKWNEQSNGQKFGNNANCHNEKSNGKLKIMSIVNDPICHDEQSNGKEKSMNKWNDANASEKLCNTKANECTDANGSDDQSNIKIISDKGKTGSDPIDFESLFPLTRIPQVGDVLAYRLIELSSSWCPEVSSFRVGQVTSYDYLSMSIVLVPVPEYPIFSNEDIERRDPILQANSSQYNDDDSLQIHYPSLVDVRLFKASSLEATTSEREMIPQEAATENSCEPAAIVSNAKDAVAQPKGNEKVAVSSWDEIRQALNEKKEELLKKDGREESNPSNSNASAAWSYKALRRSAVGPTLAYLRENNDKASL